MVPKKLNLADLRRSKSLSPIICYIASYCDFECSTSKEAVREEREYDIC